MLQIVVRQEWMYRLLSRLPASERFVKYDLRSLEFVKDEALLGYLYRRVGLHGGVTKQTNKGRFDALNDATGRLLATLPGRHVHDVGVSSGITSVDLHDYLQEHGIDHELTVSDRYARFFWQRAGLSTLLFDADGRLQCAHLAFLYADRHSTWKYPLSKLLYRWAERRKPAATAQAFLLYHPRLLTLLRNATVTHMDYDVLASPLQEAFDYVRCMNLLNAGYFDKAQLASGVSTLLQSLHPGGILQIGRTGQDGDNNVSFFRKSGDRLRLLEQIGQGSEIEALVLEHYGEDADPHAATGRTATNT